MTLKETKRRIENEAEQNRVMRKGEDEEYSGEEEYSGIVCDYCGWMLTMNGWTDVADRATRAIAYKSALKSVSARMSTGICVADRQLVEWGFSLCGQSATQSELARWRFANCVHPSHEKRSELKKGKGGRGKRFRLVTKTRKKCEKSESERMEEKTAAKENGEKREDEIEREGNGGREAENGKRRNCCLF
ncbi:hypothetical protein niasHT_005143 [Heterodera trifolii]|uniref:Uncharacterized protein n=1 Tax=Heterodera trifolii TaxID=157864 RepID=A0ABD2LRN4_9BILA